MVMLPQKHMCMHRCICVYIGPLSHPTQPTNKTVQKPRSDPACNARTGDVDQAGKILGSLNRMHSISKY